MEDFIFCAVFILNCLSTHLFNTSHISLETAVTPHGPATESLVIIAMGSKSVSLKALH